ncbi:MAG: right-handed parallel beta-helix repeat-containing protein [Thermoplasmata archaeon]|nr:MAG: right-handed parallel beta-helix repeat-containing protein [Thermoplasmata archaeon]
MYRRIVAVWISLAIVIGFIVILIDIAPFAEAPTTWYVDDIPGGIPPEDFTSIQDAINASIDGDIIFVYNGIYNENLTVFNSITLTGENMNDTIIDRGGPGDVIAIIADWVIVSNFTVKNSGTLVDDAGFKIESEHNTIFNNNISSNSRGVILRDSSHNNITGNYVWNNEFGIILSSSRDNNITNNFVFSNPQYGIALVSSSNNSFVNNIVHDNFLGIMLDFSSCNNTIISNNISSHPNNGIDIWRSSNWNLIEDNIISWNSHDGIEIYSSANNNTIILNIISYHDSYGISISSSTGNRIYHNSILNNINQASDDSINYWDDGYPSGGNYWSDYTGVDLNSTPSQDVPPPDGIGDTPYIIDSDSQDNYPLMEPYNPLENYTVLKQGWNLISLPLIQQDETLEKVLEMIDGNYDAVQFYDNSAPGDPWIDTKVDKSFGNELFELNHKMGIWIHITKIEETIFLYNGTQPTSNQTIHLYKGWNMVGYPSLKSYNRTNGLNNLTFGTHVDLIEWYDASIQTWQTVGENDYFVPGRGYWIHASVECEWEVPL